MNAGFLSWILILVTFILLASGWKTFLLRGVSYQAILTFFAAWCVASRFDVSMGKGWAVNGVIVPLLILIGAALWRQRSFLGGLHGLSFGLFLASVYYLLKHMGDIDPFFLPSRVTFGAALILALLAAILVRKPEDQIACLSFALLCGSALYGYVHKGQSAMPFAGLPFQDEWWLAVGSARLMSSAAETVVGSVCEVSKSLADRWRETRK
ncbi:hypothetical protein [Paenibacillus oceani]|uniref:Transmembrane protein n=1 Tax=Paenibacillus oceani TaxID=2772510 RepID=A0A927GYR5_9BACL|nr:hypothetical protein [Paenibacillus oceani]MBD2861332.1 hypothetical protein [Paenibacillus oceani]